MKQQLPVETYIELYTLQREYENTQRECIRLGNFSKLEQLKVVLKPLVEPLVEKILENVEVEELDAVLKVFIKQLKTKNEKV